MVLKIEKIQGEWSLQYEELCAFAFQFEPHPSTPEKPKEEDSPNEKLCAIVEGRLASGLQIVPLEVYVNGSPMKMGGIGGVATWPEFRRQGCVAFLLMDSLKRMRENKQSLSFLFPFKQGFYRRYGWEVAGDEMRYSLPVSSLRRFEGDFGKVERWDGDIRVLTSIYHAYAKRYNGMTTRGDRWWWKVTGHMGNQKVYVYRSLEGTPLGYLAFRVKDSIFQVQEWVNLELESTKAFWNFISQHDSMIYKVKWSAPLDFLDYRVLPEAAEECHLTQRYMARIVDVEEFFRCYAWNTEALEGSLCLRIQDVYAPWNGTCFTFLVNKGKVTVTRNEGVCEDCKTAVDITTLTQMALGYHTPLELSRMGKLLLSPVELKFLTKLFPQTTNYILDYF